MRRDGGGIDERFAAHVRERGDHYLRVAALLTGDWHAAEDLVQASLVKLYRAWPRLDTSADPDAYLRRIMVNTHRSWWRARWRRETPVAVLPDRPSDEDIADRHALGVLIRQALAKLPPAAADGRAANRSCCRQECQTSVLI
jgi:RNA polymerase sigma factor (sigma-70 family)